MAAQALDLYDSCSDFDQFINGPLSDGRVTASVQMWREAYVSARSEGGTALHWACGGTRGNGEGIIRALLALGCDTEAKADSDYGGWGGWLGGWRGRWRGGWWAGWRPLHVCAYSDNRVALRVLLKAGVCRIAAVTPQGQTPLQIAERYNSRRCTPMLREAVQIKEMSVTLKLLRKNFLSNIGEQETEKVPKKEVGETVSDPLELLNNNRLSKIMDTETGKSLLEELLNGKDEKVLEAIKAKKVDAEEMNEWKSLKILQVNSQPYQSIQECLMYRCIHQNYDRGVYSLCTADIVNRASLFMGPTALETAVECGAVVWVHEILKKLVKVDKSWSAAKHIAEKKNLSDIQEMITKRKDYLTSKNKKKCSRLHLAVIENDPDMVEYLIKNDLVTADERNKNLGAALSLAYKIDHIDCARSLQASSANVNTVDRIIENPLQVAIANETEDLCEYLVNNPSLGEHVDIICAICEEEPMNCALNCGHTMCMTCARKTAHCCFCRSRIKNRTKLFI